VFSDKLILIHLPKKLRISCRKTFLIFGRVCPIFPANHFLFTADFELFLLNFGRLATVNDNGCSSVSGGSST
jgi:hypothetical protein